MANGENKIDWACLLKAFGWVTANAAFGLAPLIFLRLINPVLSRHEAGHEIHELIKGGTVLFVCCALMGAAVIDLVQSKIKFSNFAFFALYVIPFIILAIICLLYLLIILGHVNENLFTSFSDLYIFIILFTLFYCTMAKYFLFLH